MISPQTLSEAFARNMAILKMQTDGLTHEDSLRQLPFRGNCLNWILGHIASYRDMVLEMLGEPPMMGADGVRYKKESEPITGAEEGILSMEELLNLLDREQEGITAALGRMSETTLSREVMLGERKLTVGQRMFNLCLHESYHIGQTEILRQLTGKDDKVSM